MNTKAKGDITVAAVLAALAKKGKRLLLPFGDNLPYDLVIDEEGRFTRVQCKTGRLRRGAVRFNACSNYAHRGRDSEPYYDKADLFGVYCPETDAVYLIPVSDCGRRIVSLRIEPSKNCQVVKVRAAIDYLV